MSAIGERDMPVIDAWPLSGTFAGHYAAAFPDGERTYPSRNAVFYAAARAGAAVRFVDADPAARSAAHSEVTPPASTERPSSTRDASTSRPVSSGEGTSPG